LLSCALLAIVLSAASDHRPNKLPANSGCEHFDVAVAERLAHAANVEELDAAFPSTSEHHDLPIIALYRSQRLRFVPTSAEELRYLRSLPKSSSELWCVYRLTYPSAVSDTDAVSATVYGMFDRTAAVVHEHRTGYVSLLHLALWSDGELAEVAWDWFPDMLRRDRREMITALRSLPLSDQRRICGTAIVKLPEDEVVRRCSVGVR
jgi:hypothetical protein